MNMLRKLYANAGQTLVEILIAFGIGVVVITSMTIAVTTAVSNSIYSKNQSLANQYAQEGIELVRNEQQSSYQSLNNMVGKRYCLDQTQSCNADISTCSQHATGSNCAPNINNNTFIRQVDILAIGAAGSKCVGSIQASVSVLWIDGKCPSGTYCHQDSVVSCFSDANVIQSP